MGSAPPMATACPQPTPIAARILRSQAWFPPAGHAEDVPRRDLQTVARKLQPNREEHENHDKLHELVRSLDLADQRLPV